MPSVASEVQVPPFPRLDPAPARANPSSRAPETPFDEVLDAATNGAATPAPRSDRTDRPSRSNDSPEPSAPAATTPRDAGKPAGALRDPAATTDAQVRPASGKSDGKNKSADQSAPSVNDTQAGDAAPPLPDQDAAKTIAPVVIAITTPATNAAVLATKDTDTTARDADITTADKKDAEPAAAAPADQTAAAPVAVTPTVSPAAIAAVAIPVVVATDATAANPQTASDAVTGTDATQTASAPATAVAATSAEPALSQDAKAALDAAAKALPATGDAIDSKDAKDAAPPSSPAAAAAPAKLAQSVTQTLADAVTRGGDKTDRPKAQHGRVEALAKPAASTALTAQNTDAPSDANADKPAAPAVSAHAPAPDRTTAPEHTLTAAHTTPGENHDAAAAATGSSATGTAQSAVNTAAPALAPTPLTPVTALRVDIATNTPVPIAGLAVEIVARAESGLKRFDIRLDPPDLGRIDVRLDVARDGRVTSHVIVERSETLDLLRRDAPQLERALQQAGLKTDGGIDFSLRDQSFANQNMRDQSQNGASANTQLIIPDDDTITAETVRGYGRLIGLGGGVDIRV